VLSHLTSRKNLSTALSCVSPATALAVDECRGGYDWCNVSVFGVKARPKQLAVLNRSCASSYLERVRWAELSKVR